ncbi:MAG: hypothetical protein AB4352_09740 [Hormoscilla sp.]
MLLRGLQCNNIDLVRYQWWGSEVIILTLLGIRGKEDENGVHPV